MNRKVMSAISVFQVKFNVEFTCQAVNLSARAETKETLSKSMRFLILLSVNGFLKFSKILNFNSRFGKHSFSVNSFISKVFFPNTSCIFVFTIATMFARDSRQQYRFMHKCNSTLNTLSSIANQSAGLPSAMQF